MWAYLAVPQLSFKSLLLPELLLNGIHYQTPSLNSLWYHPLETSCLLYLALRHADCRSIHQKFGNYHPDLNQIKSLMDYCIGLIIKLNVTTVIKTR